MLVAFLLSSLLTGWALGPAPPTLSLTAPATSFVDETVVIDARLSTGISNLPQTNGTTSVTIDFGDGFSCTLLACGHAYRTAGSYTITLTGKAADGSTASTTAGIVVSSIPAATGGAIQNLTDSGNATTNATNLQSAINTAVAANTVEQEIRLNGNWALINGPIVMTGAESGSKYITITWTGLTVPHLVRVFPANMTNAPTIITPSDVTKAAIWTANTAPGAGSQAHHYRLQGLHIGKFSDGTSSQTLVNFGTDSGGGQTTIAQAPYNFIMDRCWLDGGASDTSQTTNGLRIYANTVSVVDSYLGQFRLIGAGVDTAAISLSYGQKGYAFVNNTMIATSENMSVSGGPLEANTATVSAPTTTSCTLSSVTNLELDENIALVVGGRYGVAQSTIIRSISGNNVTFDAIPTAPDNGSTAIWQTVPSYAEFRSNYLYKPLTWWPSDPSWNGITYQIKNLFETKFARYWTVDGNVFQNQWIAAQTYAITLTVRDNNGGGTHAAVVRQLQFSNNIFRNCADGVSITPGDDPGGDGYTQATTDITFRNDLFRNVGYNWDPTGSAHMMVNLLGQVDGVNVARAFFVHITHDNGTPNNSNGVITDFGGSGGGTSCYWLNSVHQDGGAGFRSNASNTDMAANIVTFLPPGTSTNWNANLIVNTNGHTYPAAAITQSATWTTGVFVDYANGNFTLQGGSPGHNAALDGTDCGVDMVALTAATRNAISGGAAGNGSGASNGAVFSAGAKLN